jgi:DNA-directed RNA polymerase specialized sigma24 family protein
VARAAVLKQVRDLDINHDDISLDAFLEDGLPSFCGPEDDFVSHRVDEEVDRLEPVRQAAVRGRFYEGKTDDEIAAEQGTTRRIVGYRRRQGLAEIAEHLRDVPFTSVCPKAGFPGYYYTMTDVKRNEPALLGGEVGDCS